VLLHARRLVGVGFLEREEKIASEGTHCHQCGAELPPSSAFCPQCGAKRLETGESLEAAAAPVKTVEKRATAVSAEGIGGFVFGLIGLVFMFMPFYAATESMGSPLNFSMTLGVSGFDVARGAVSFFGYSLPLGFSFAVIWLVLLGSILALVSGLLGVLTSASAGPSSSSAERAFGMLVAISGIVVMVGSIVAATQIMGMSMSYSTDLPVTGYGTVTVDISSYPGFGVFGEVAIGTIIMTLGLIMAGKAAKGH
jgi:ribosomal protein L40E